MAVKPRVHVQRHHLKRERHNALADKQCFKEHPAIYPAGYSHPNARTGVNHFCNLHQFSGGANTVLLMIT